MKEIKKLKFNILTWIHPIAYPYKPIGWYANNSESVIAALVLDEVDRDFGFILLGRDKRKIFRTIDVCKNFNNSFDKIFIELAKKLKDYDSEPPSKIFEQQDEKESPFELFNLCVPDEKLHVNFKSLNNPIHNPAKLLLTELGYQYKTQDKNFIKEFQTQFDSRLWEFFLYFFLLSEDFKFGKQQKYPDFIVTKNNDEIALEATTVNIGKIDTQIFKDLSLGKNLQTGYFPIKFGSPLHSKLNKKYWKKKNLKGLPFIFAIHDYHQPGAMIFSETTLREYLYGVKLRKVQKENTEVILWDNIPSHEWEKKNIPSGFFNQEDTQNISAILLATTATIAKFNRLGKLAGFGGEDLVMLRHGIVRDPNPESTEPIPFLISIDDPYYHETWSEGMILFHNPKAKTPLSWNIFENITQVGFDKDTGFFGNFVDFDVISSITSVFKL